MDRISGVGMFAWPVLGDSLAPQVVGEGGLGSRGESGGGKARRGDRGGGTDGQTVLKNSGWVPIRFARELEIAPANGAIQVDGKLDEEAWASAADAGRFLGTDGQSWAKLGTAFRVLLVEERGLPGFVASIQTFGSQVQFHPHVHSLVTDGLLFPGGGFHPMCLWDDEIERLFTETFRRLVLDALVTEDRLSVDFRDRLPGFRHGGGSSVYGRHLILNEEPARLEHMARYAVRPPVAQD